MHVVEGKKLCEDCIEDTIKCNRCKTRIFTNHSIDIIGIKYCRTCTQTCDKCKNMMVEAYLIHGLIVCETCRNKLMNTNIPTTAIPVRTEYNIGISVEHKEEIEKINIKGDK